MPVRLLALQVGCKKGDDERQKKKTIDPEFIYAEEVEG